MQRLIHLGIAQTILYGAIAWLSEYFEYGSVEQERPILPLLALFVGIFALYLVAIRAAVRCPDNARLAWAILIPAFAFRGVLLPTAMIQEVDLYRYLWDGAVTARGVNPYLYSPAQVLASETQENLPDKLQQLITLRKSSPELEEILRRVHFAELPTVYPPVSQAVFALGNMLSPAGTSVANRMLILKALIVAFDVGTIGMVWLILRRLNWHPGWVVAYAWCPLVIKEFANSGHLDAIAVFFTMASVWCVVEMVAKPGGRWGRVSLFGGGVAMAMAIGAKLYPVILLPLLMAAIAATRSQRQAVFYVALTVILSGVLVAPMLLTKPATLRATAPTETAETVELPPPADNPQQTTGLKAFLTQWEMNDFLFMLIFENLRPADPNRGRPLVWFAIFPNSWREACVVPLAQRLGTDTKMASFLLTRALTTCLFLTIAMGFAWRVYRRPQPEVFLEAAFLTLAWFWLLSPTQNPWYWIWTLPMLPFARARAWYVVSGLTLIYYLRFWLRYHYSDCLVLGTPYNGAQFFDFVVTWLEYAPWFAWLALSAYLQGTDRGTAELDGSKGSVADFTDAAGHSNYDSTDEAVDSADNSDR